MKIVKPTKLPILHRVVEIRRRPYFHVAAILSFPLQAPRALCDELTFWQATSAALGETGVFDEGFAKARGELLVCGHFFAPGGRPLTASFVRARVGAVDKRLAVAGDRVWQNQIPTPPQPFTTLPLDWAHAFGGAGFDRNPYGKGAAPLDIEGRPVHPLPNVETYGKLLRSPNERPTPAGFLPMDVTFAQRRARAGTYDKRYLDDHFPGMPPDMDPTFYNVAPEDQWAPEFFRGDEDFLLENMHAERPKIEGQLPGLSVRVLVTQRVGSTAPPTSGPLREIAMRCDTVWLFPTIGLGAVVFHGSMPIVEDDAADILHLVAACEDPLAPRSVEHYQQALARRLDKDKGALHGISDTDLMPPISSGVSANLGVTDTDLGRWVRSENLALTRGRRGMEREIAKARAQLEAEGLDLGEHGALELSPAPDLPPLDDLDALATFMEARMATAQEQGKALQAKAEDAKEQARKNFAEMGMDYDAEMAKAEKEGGGPPKFSAVKHLTDLSVMAAEAAAEGVPLDELEAQLDDPRYWEELKAQEQGLRDMYRRFGHLQPAASPMDGESSDRIRLLVEVARESDESLEGRDFTGVHISGINLSGLDLSGAFLESADLSKCDLRGACLINAVLARANLSGADLRGAQLTGANLGGADLRGAVLDNTEMTGAVLSRAELSAARFRDAHLEGADWMEVKPGAVDLTGARLGQCTFLKADFSGACFAAADLSQATFIECQLDEADFSRATMTKTTFVDCKGAGVSFKGASLGQSVFVHGSLFPDADFTGAAMEKANLRGTLLEGARFDRADLSQADLSDCEASRASFDRASMKGGLLVRTRLEGASLRGANWMEVVASKVKIAGADFTGANLYGADLSRAVRDAETSFSGAKIDRIRVLPKAEVPVAPGRSPNPS